MRAFRRLPHLCFLVGGLAVGLLLALAPLTIGLGLLLAWLLADLLFVHLPRLRRGPGPAREALLRDEARRRATWAVLPPPRRPRPRTHITVAAIAGGPPAVRPVDPLDLPTPPAGRAIRVVSRPAVLADRTLLTACWEAATRRSAELIDQVALELGLACDRLRPVAIAEPDPLLTAATWSRLAA